MAQVNLLEQMQIHLAETCLLVVLYHWEPLQCLDPQAYRANPVVKENLVHVVQREVREWLGHQALRELEELKELRVRQGRQLRLDK